MSTAALSGVVYLIITVSHLSDIERRLDLAERQIMIYSQDVSTVKNSYITPQQHEVLRTLVDGLKQDTIILGQRQLQVLTRLDRIEQYIRENDKVQQDQDQRIRVMESQIGTQRRGP